MLRLRDLYTQHEVLSMTDDSNAVVGTLINDYEVRQYTDVRDLGLVYGFTISVSQRLVVPATLSTASPKSGYVGYPAYLTNTITPTISDGTLELIDYSPITVNTSVDSSVNSTVGTNASDSSQYTSGSSTSVTNTYDVSVNLSEMGGIGGGYSHSQTDTVDQSQTVGRDTGVESQLGSSNSMSIKEWGSYLSIDVGAYAPTWTWTQEYPWNTYLYQDKSASQNVLLPPFIENRLFLVPSDVTKATAAPPSAISLRGLTFMSKARWAYFPKSADSISFGHAISYATASHTLDNKGNGSASITPVTVTLSSTSSSVNDLSSYALDPLTASRGSLVTFAPSQFRQTPATPAGSFTVASAGNDILVQGSGFTFSPQLDSIFQADVSKSSATFTVTFKVTDSDRDYSLYLKHWKLSDTGCTLSITINQDAPAIVRHIDAKESEGGSDNVLRVYLRNLDYTSTDFYDYLVIGHNTITVNITSEDATGASSSVYALRSLAVG